MSAMSNLAYFDLLAADSVTAFWCSFLFRAVFWDVTQTYSKLNTQTAW